MVLNVLVERQDTCWMMGCDLPVPITKVMEMALATLVLPLKNDVHPYAVMAFCYQLRSAMMATLKVEMDAVVCVSLKTGSIVKVLMVVLMSNLHTQNCHNNSYQEMIIL